jgi:hypothetical protein
MSGIMALILYVQGVFGADMQLRLALACVSKQLTLQC